MNSSLSDRPLPEDLRTAIDRARQRIRPFGAHVHFFPSVGSTNDVAAMLAASGAREGTVVVADMQTAGRGRRGHEWFSPPGAGLYVSIVLRPEGADRHQPTLLTLTAGVALAEGVAASTGLQPEIKWPNDLLVGPRKLAGILAEAVTEEAIVLGFGVNLTRAAYPASIGDRATSIEHELGRVPDRGVVFTECLAALATRYVDLAAGRVDAILSRWRSLSRSSEGARVEWTTPQGVIRGITHGIDDTGALLVRVGARIERIVGGTVTWL